MRALLITICLSTTLLAQSSPVPLINQPLIPAAAVPGGQSFTLTVNGTGFVPASVVKWNGNPRSTTYVSTSKLTAAIQASDVVQPGTASVTVASPGGGLSNVQFFEVTSPSRSLVFASSSFPAGNEPEAIAVADLNGDGHMDVVTADLVGTVSVSLGNAGGTFQTPVFYPIAPDGPTALAVRDVNSDGKLDLVILDAIGQISVLLGNGDGTFQPEKLFPFGGSEADSFVLGDFNGDGNVDVVITESNYGSLFIMLGDGAGGFLPATRLLSDGSDPFSPVAGDFNHDNKLDLALINRQGLISILLGNGDGTFRNTATYSIPPNASFMIAADLNGDGNLDLAAFSIFSVSSISVLLGNDDGTFQPAVSYQVTQLPGYGWGLAAGDLDGDGILDLVLDVGYPQVLFGKGDGSFPTQPLIISTQPNGPAVLADFNGDGRLDIAMSNPTSESGYVLVQSPVVSPSPSLVSFGDVPVQTTSSQTVTISNTGSAALQVSSLVLAADPDVFSLNNGCQLSVPVGANCEIEVSFAPKSLTSYSAPIRVYDNAGQSPQTITVSGTGAGAVATLTPPSLNFGNANLNIPSATLTSTLLNSGNIPLTIASIGLVGANPGAFAQTNTCVPSLAPATSCTFSVTFTPTSSGAASADISIVDNAPGGSQLLALAGNGVSPAVKLSPAKLTFPDQTVFSTSSVQHAVLTNTGAGILQLGGIAVTGPFALTSTCLSTLSSGASCALGVTFSPKAKGPLSGAISITDNASGSPQKLTLAGTGTYAQFSPASINFGSQPVGAKSVAKRLAFTNKGGTAIGIGTISIAGANAAEFAQVNNCRATLASGASCFISVTFTPAATGTRTAAVSFTDNGGGSPQSVPLAGTGT